MARRRMFALLLRRSTSFPGVALVGTAVAIGVMQFSATFPIAQAQTVLLDNFESSTLRVVQPNETDPQWRFLWNEYTGEGQLGLATTSSDAAYTGSRSLRVRTAGDVYLQFYPHDGSAWLNMREFVQPSSAWSLDTFNRMRFWVKVPPQVRPRSDGSPNIHFGTYVRRQNGSSRSAEDGGGHWYHHLNLPATGAWHQVIIDTHPNHLRGAPGGTEHGDQEYVTGEAGFNYFDALTRFYFAYQDGPEPGQADWYFDDFELYRETHPENIAQIYSLHGAYVAASNKVLVGWMHKKDETNIQHEVRYAFSDIWSIGWASATPAPNGMVSPPGQVGYNGMEWSSTALPLTGRSVLYVAIKPTNSSSFRQIQIPLAPGTTGPTGQPPRPPANLRVIG